MHSVCNKKQLPLGLLIAALLVTIQFTAFGQQTIISGDWNTQADTYLGRNGERFTHQFPPGGTISGRLWATDLNTDDGSIATAAVHAGLISVEEGGIVVIEIQPGADSYEGSTRYGVSSSNWGAYSGSFVFVK